MAEIKKWGFGAAPFKRATEIKNRKALVALRRFLCSELQDYGTLPESISHVKGMFNRILRQDQWDWFTTNMYFDYPNLKEARFLVSALTDLRKAVTVQCNDDIENIKNKLKKTNLSKYIDSYLNYDAENEQGDEFVYILSRKEEKELLKIGMTKRNVLKRCCEINSATGVVYPFSPRRVFRVNDAHTAERVVHEALAEWRIRSDREFFLMDYYTAVEIIVKQLTQNQLLYYKYPFTSV